MTSRNTPPGATTDPEPRLGRVADRFANLSLKYMPDPFILAILLTLLVFLTAFAFSGMGFVDGFDYWAAGWMGPEVLLFMAQIVISVIGGYAVVTAPPSRRLFLRIAALPRTPRQAIAAVTLTAMGLSYLHWVFGIIMSGLFAKQVAERVPGIHYPLLIASAFSGYIVWHGGLSGIVPQSVATAGHPLEDQLGVIPVSETIFDPVNLTILGVLVLTVPLLNAAMHPRKSRTIEISQSELARDAAAEEASLEPALDGTADAAGAAGPAERLGRSRMIGLLLAAFGAVFLIARFLEDGFSLNINILNLIFITVGLTLYRHPVDFARSVTAATALIVAPILLLFPLYGGIAGLIAESGLGAEIVSFLSEQATASTLPVVTFLVAGLMNLFVPSGGGLWLLEGPLVAQSAEALGSSPGLNVIAFAWGDNWTNMMQPFWALPMLALAGLQARHIVGYTLLVGLWEGVVVIAALLLLPLLF